MSLDSLVNGTDVERISSDLDDVRVERIDEAEVPYLQVVADQLAELPQIDAQIEALQAHKQALQGASDSYLLYLFNRYGYDPNTTSLERDGTFKVRE
jgi:hypothetical protein